MWTKDKLIVETSGKFLRKTIVSTFEINSKIVNQYRSNIWKIDVNVRKGGEIKIK